MTLTDIQRIERELATSFPDRYRELLLNYPFGNDSFGTMCMLLREPDVLIDQNRHRTAHFMLHHRRNGWIPGEEHLFIGNDGGEEEYYLDLSTTPQRVLQYDLETSELTTFARDLDAYVARIREIDAEIEADEKLLAERRKNAKWWQFWRTW